VLVILGLKCVIALVYIYLYQTVFEGNDLENYSEIAYNWKQNIKTGLVSIHQLLFLDQGVSLELLEQPRVVFFSKIVFLLKEISFQNIYLSGIILCVLNYTIWLESFKLIKKINENLGNTFLITLLVPSILFWTSGLNKEAICLPLAIYLMCFIYKGLNQKIEYREVFLSIVSIYFIWKLRYFYIPTIGLVAIIYTGFFFYKDWKYWMTVIGMSILVLGFQSYLPYPLRFENFSHLVYENYHIMARKSELGRYLKIEFPNDNILSIGKAALISIKGSFHLVFFNTFSTLQSLENGLFFIGVLWLVIQWKKMKITKEVIVLIIFILITAMLINLVCPNYGSLSRYKVIYWFWLTFLVIHNLPFLKQIKEDKN